MQRPSVSAACATVRDAVGQAHPCGAADARIVSLVPSITELLFELGLGPQMVGRTGFCIHPRAAVRTVPKVGGTKDVKLDQVRALAPSHVVVNVDENTREVFDALRRFVPHVIVTHPNAPQDNPALYRLLGAVFDREAEAAALTARFDAALAALARAVAGAPPRRVLYLIWREPWMTVGPDTYIARMLELVNWRTVPRPATARYPTLAPDELEALAPELCLLSSEPYPFRAQHGDEVRALAGGHADVHLVDGEMVSWYGSRAIAGLGYLAGLARELCAAPA